ncbi:MAG: hypothetical protein QW650_00150 [Thermofilum sp.]
MERPIWSGKTRVIAYVEGEQDTVVVEMDLLDFAAKIGQLLAALTPQERRDFLRTAFAAQKRIEEERRDGYVL